MTALGWEGWGWRDRAKRKRTHGTDNSVVIVGRMEARIRKVNGNGKKCNKKFLKNKIK